MRILAIILTLCSLTFVSCRTLKSKKSEFKSEVKTENKKDSVIVRETVRIDTVKFAQESANLAVPFSLLRDDLLNYMEKSNGRAKVIIQRVGDSIFVEAKCDSLERLVASKSTELRQWQQYALEQSIKEQSKESVVKIDVPWWFKIALIAIVVMQLAPIVSPIVKRFSNLIQTTNGKANNQ